MAKDTEKEAEEKVKKAEEELDAAKKAKEVPEVEEKKEVELPIVVVNQIPQVETRVGFINDGKDQVNLITIEEAMTEIYNEVKAMKKAIG